MDLLKLDIKYEINPSDQQNICAVYKILGIYILKLKVDHSSDNAWWWSPLWRSELTEADPQPRRPGGSRNVPVSVAQFPPPPFPLWMEPHWSINQPRIKDVKFFEWQKCVLPVEFWIYSTMSILAEMQVSP